MRRTTIFSLAMAGLMLAAPSGAASLMAEPFHEAPMPVVFNQPTIKVLLEHRSKGAVLEVPGRYLVTDPKTGKRLTSGLLGKRFAVRPGEDGILWSEEYSGIYQLELIPRRADRTFWIDGVQYTGTLYIYQIGNTLSLVNEVPIEDYVAAVVEACCDESVHTEAARAVAICARTDAWYHRQHAPSSFWNVYAPEVGFKGVGGLTEDSKGALASKATKGLYVTHPQFASDKGIFSSRWTQHSAGVTVSYNQLNPERHESGNFSVQLQSARMDRDRTEWHSIVTQAQVEKAFDLAAGSLKGLSLAKDPQTQKVIAINIETTTDNRNVSYFRFAQALGADVVKSSDFSIKAQGSQHFQLTGFGRGDGVGLCLYTADKMAEEGQRAPSILQVFFPGSSVEQLQFK